jgi:hypothetical protein
MITTGRPSLVIMSSIEETLEFSAKLKSEGIIPQILNDVQIEDEDYIVRRAGYPRAVTIATNAAGRGTDIVLSGGSEFAGGLHVVVAFFPINFRVECQIICSIDEPFVSQTLDISNVNDDAWIFYAFRSKWIESESIRRLNAVKRDRIFFKLLQCYFDYVKELVSKNRECDRAKVQLERIYGERIWCDFFDELDQGMTELPNESDVDSWKVVKFDEFKRRVSEVMSY